MRKIYTKKLLNKKYKKNRKTRINNKHYLTKKIIYGGTKKGLGPRAPTSLVPGRPTRSVQVPSKVTAGLSINLGNGNSFLAFPKIKPGKIFGENSKKTHLFPQYTTLTDLRKFIASFKVFYQKYIHTPIYFVMVFATSIHLALPSSMFLILESHQLRIDVCMVLRC